MKQVLTNIGITLVLAILGFATTFAKAENSGCVIAGNDEAALTIEEFSDFECPYCIRGANTMKEVLRNYPGKIKLVFRNLPLPFHQNALMAAKAFSAVCMQSPSLAYSYQEELFNNQDKLIAQGESFLYETAEKIGVSVSKMKEDMNGETVANMISGDQQIADSYKFKGTPSFMIGTEPVVGAYPYEEIKKVIERQLGK